MSKEGKQNVLARCVIPRIVITMRYILSELDEQEREESFRLKRFKQLKYKNAKPIWADTEESEEESISSLLEEEEGELTKRTAKGKHMIQAEGDKTIPPVAPHSFATNVPPPPKVEPIMPPTLEVDPCSSATKVPPPPKDESIMPPTLEVDPCSSATKVHPPAKDESIMPPTLEVDPCSSATKVPPPPKVEPIMPPTLEVDPCSSATKVTPPPEVEPIISPPPKVDPCSDATKVPPPKEKIASPTTTQKRLDHLMKHLNEILQIAKELQASKQTPRIENFIKCCDEVKSKIKDLSSAPSSVTPSALSEVQSIAFELGPVNKTTLGEFEKRFEEKIKVTRTRNPNGTINEEKQIITIRTEIRMPYPEKDSGGAKSPYGSGGQYSRGKRGDGSGGGKKRGGTRSPSCTSKTSVSQTHSRSSKFSESRTPSSTSKPCGTPKLSDTAMRRGAAKSSESLKSCRCHAPSVITKPSESETPSRSSKFSGSRTPSSTPKSCGTPKPYDTSKLCGTPKPSDTAMPRGAAKSSEFFKSCGCRAPRLTTKPSGIPRPGVTLSGCPKIVSSNASASRQSSDTCSCGSSGFSTTGCYMTATSYPLPRNEPCSCGGSPKRLMMNTCSSKSTASSLLGSNTCSCISVNENQSKELPDPMITRLTFKSESTSVHSFFQNLPENPKKSIEKYSGDKSTYCIPDCNSIWIGKNASTQSKCLFAIASPSPSTTNNSLKRAKAGQSECTRISSNTTEPSIDSAIVVRGSRLNTLRKAILPSVNSTDFHIRGITSVSKLSSYTCLCASSQTSASSIKIWQAPFQLNPECLTCQMTKQSKVEAGISYTQSRHSSGSQSVSFKNTPEPTSCAVLAECKAALAALAEHIRNARSFSPSSSNISYPTFGTPTCFNDAMASLTPQDSNDSHQFEALFKDKDHERVSQRLCSSSADTHLENEQDQCNLVQKVSSSSKH